MTEWKSTVRIPTDAAPNAFMTVRGVYIESNIATMEDLELVLPTRDNEICISLRPTAVIQVIWDLAEVACSEAGHESHQTMYAVAQLTSEYPHDPDYLLICDVTSIIRLAELCNLDLHIDPDAESHYRPEGTPKTKPHDPN